MAAKKRRGRPKKLTYYSRVTVSLSHRTANALVRLWGKKAKKMTFDEMIYPLIALAQEKFGEEETVSEVERVKEMLEEEGPLMWGDGK